MKSFCKLVTTAMVFVAVCTSGTYAQGKEGGEEKVIDMNGGETIDVGNGQTMHMPPKAQPETSTQADLGYEEDTGMSARTNIKDESSLHRLVQGIDGSGGSSEEKEAVVGFFEPDEDGGVKNREDEDSAYQLFRKAALKNPKVPFAKVVDGQLAAKFGVKKLPSIIYMVIPESERAASTVHLRRAQFFDDLTVYKNDDPNRIFGTYEAAGGFRAWGPEQALKMLRANM